MIEKLEAAAQQVDRKSVLGRAIHYFLSRRDQLLRFVDDGMVEIDNNLLENRMRKIALLRKNALFAGTEMGAETWTVLASLVGTCELNGVDPWAYFRWLFERIEARRSQSRYHELLPWKCPHGRR